MLAKLNSAFTRAVDHQNFGKLLLRLTFGILVLFHGVAKMENGVGWIAQMLQADGLPGFIAYGAYIGEVIAPVLIILGIFTRPAALVLAFNILVAVFLVVGGKFFTVTEVGAWGLEGEALYFLGGLAIMFLGSGRYSVMKNEALR
ncbi:putative membrane protein [Rahnella aquatilis CIP 78.65 = ATCC 33071]|uniref:Putative membrane protein n=1 Tax=Rahnella aquatilis (strain ATCC 33071 / DSM 4594 / JCM 1683 / NBRC 105701 / NCIMB 13365 / CIP 78.65) TaxID=745277 RepID=H2IUW9_RAHAC|nr:DoxX family protein [Rahnella aquatilis]AEX52825.1 putative membrane protein [Rahnella aquatilis CIP 78.65 = ATCC 33071]KFD05381.1 putative membrane protein [Rahnella aquatilis CIP 78.65 = ATCC 33071]